MQAFANDATEIASEVLAELYVVVTPDTTPVIVAPNSIAKPEPSYTPSWLRYNTEHQLIH